MQFFMNNDVNNEFGEILKKELIKRIQKENASISFNKMLIWYFMQRSEFDQALLQEIAVDKRLNATGKAVLELADLAKAANDYETALKAYDYVIEKGKSKPYFYPAQSGKLNVYYLKVINGLIQTPDEMKNLEDKYLEVIQSSGFTTYSIRSIVDLAHLQAFYLNKPDDAEKLLREAIDVQGIEPQISALCKIELGDVLLFNENPDYAALIYGQVEKDNKDNTLGDNAKLKKAKLAYYTGNFLWAKAQFDALKESTSKPVANDALFYSVLIDENSEGDSLLIALKTYAKAELNVFRNKTDLAVVLLDSLITAFPSHQIIDETYLLKADIFVLNKNYADAEINYKKVFTDYAYDIHADAALFKLGILYEQKMNRIEDAAELYKQLMLLYPESIFVSEARKRFRKIREL
jgi:TolA-binding protein